VLPTALVVVKKKVLAAVVSNVIADAYVGFVCVFVEYRDASPKKAAI
jgi:hypothetical protein